MKQVYINHKTSANFRLTLEEYDFDRSFYGKDRKDKLLTIAWNKGEEQTVTIDEVNYALPANAVVTLMVNQTFHFENPIDIVAWQFNRDFYCIVDHDKEVSCVGFLFYGSTQQMIIRLDAKEQRKLGLLLDIMLEEFETQDDIQESMLRMLLIRLIIIITRLGKQQYLDQQTQDDARFKLFREFNLLVEQHYKTAHNVQFYADKLFKSPKTLSNAFALYNRLPPLQIIQQRVILEAKRLLYYTEKSIKEIADELGFEDASHFSRFFKKNTGYNPTDFKNDFQAQLLSK